MSMKILVLGGGGREHALVWKLSYSPHRPQIFVAPGNPGVEGLATRVPVAATDLEAVVRFAESEGIDLVLSGPEAPLVSGVSDMLAEVGIACLGPDRLPAMLEGSKSYAKLVMDQFKIPHAPYQVFREVEPALEYIRTTGRLTVLKADGLCAGKGVFLPGSLDEARSILHRILVDRCFGDQGRSVVIEERLEGIEGSFICFTDGVSVLPMESARDYKRAHDGDTGPNTGGMGCISPNPAMNEAVVEQVLETVVTPLLAGLREAGTPYRGILYTGLMFTAEGPKVLEFNVRFGDPEAQVILPRLSSDLLEILLATTEERLGDVRPFWDWRPAVCVVLAAPGYPGEVRTGIPIHGLKGLGSADVLVSHAGTEMEEGGLVTSGGRVLSVTALARDLDQARARAYEAVDAISFEGKQVRTDIGRDVE